MDRSADNDSSMIEAILLLESEPATEEFLAKVTGFSPLEVIDAIERLKIVSAQEGHGIMPVKSQGGWILAPKLEFWESLKDHYGKRNEMKLSRAAMETLAIIAYSQPITRSEIEAIRGVSADGMMRYLLARGLVQEVGKKDVPGKPIQYGTTKDFLAYFRLGSIADLPRLDDIENRRFGLNEGEEG